MKNQPAHRQSCTGLSRRSFLKAAAAFAGFLLLPPWGLGAAAPGPFSSEVNAKRENLLAAYRETLRRYLRQSRLPIIDIEHHWGGSIPTRDLIAKMDRNVVALTWLGANEKNGSRSSLTACGQFPDRLVPTTIHGDGRRWHGHDLTVVQELADDVRSGEYFAMGEFEARHYISNTNNRDIHMPADSPSFHGVFQAAAETGVPFLLHHEAEDALLPELEKMLAQYPKATVVWCHVGRNRNPRTWTEFPTPAGVRKFIEKYPNLYFDILVAGTNAVFPPTGARENLLYVNNDDPSRLKPEWKALFEDYADRFLIGSDVNTGRWDGYDRVFERMRSSVLRSLAPAAVEKIAFKNAWRLMSGETWQ